MCRPQLIRNYTTSTIYKSIRHLSPDFSLHLLSQLKFTRFWHFLRSVSSDQNATLSVTAKTQPSITTLPIQRSMLSCISLLHMVMNCVKSCIFCIVTLVISVTISPIKVQFGYNTKSPNGTFVFKSTCRSHKRNLQFSDMLSILLERPFDTISSCNQDSQSSIYSSRSKSQTFEDSRNR